MLLLMLICCEKKTLFLHKKSTTEVVLKNNAEKYWKSSADLLWEKNIVPSLKYCWNILASSSFLIFPEKLFYQMFIKIALASLVKLL
jgi:hypothetical protein